MKHEPIAVARAKMDTPVGLFGGACSCGWRSDGLTSESNALKDARQHADALTANENRTVLRYVDIRPSPPIGPDEVRLMAGGAGWMGSFTKVVVTFLDDLLSDGEPVEVALIIENEDEGQVPEPHVMINGRLTAIIYDEFDRPLRLGFADRYEVDVNAVLSVTV